MKLSIKLLVSGMAILIAMFILVLMSLKETQTWSRWYGDFDLSQSGEWGIFASGYRDDTYSGLFVVNLPLNVWTFLFSPNYSFRNPVVAHESNYVIATAIDQNGIHHITKIDINSGSARKIFSSKDPVSPMVLGPQDKYLVYEKAPYCDLKPSERCGGRSDLFLYDFGAEKHIELTKIWSAGFSKATLVSNTEILLGIPFMHRPGKRDSERGDGCTKGIHEDSVFVIKFSQALERTPAPISTDCSWKPLIKGALGNSSWPIMAQSGKELLYLSIDKTNPSKYTQALYKRNLDSGSDQLIWHPDSISWYETDISDDGQTVASLHDFKSLSPKVWFKDLTSGKEKILEPSSSKLEKKAIHFQTQ
ncbi:MAG: hypothetical protein AB7H97_15005 [Pseudobdellovibrionaceae bacterium]